ncbi:MAG: hypothetical protein QME51_09115 [Planctomycetota bacterium]|nr:hypothetical protein [Planctomycetota bacterium]
MKLKDLVCPKCEKRGLVLFSDAEEPIFEVLLVCALDHNTCGTGVAIIDTNISPLEWIQRILDCFPRSGEPIKVNKDEKESVILGFSYRGKSYDQMKTILSCSKVNQKGIRETWYLVELSDGMALIQQREDITLETSSQPETWLLIEIKKGETPSVEEDVSPGRVNYATSGYRIIYEIEDLFRSLISNKFANRDELFKAITIERKGQQQTLYKILLQRKEQEESESYTPLTGGSLIDYMDWSEWIDLFRLKFADLFPRKEGLRNRFITMLDESKVIRNKVAHMRPVTLQDIELLRKTKQNIKDITSNQP